METSITLCPERVFCWCYTRLNTCHDPYGFSVMRHNLSFAYLDLCSLGFSWPLFSFALDSRAISTLTFEPYCHSWSHCRMTRCYHRAFSRVLSAMGSSREGQMHNFTLFHESIAGSWTGWLVGMNDLALKAIVFLLLGDITVAHLPSEFYANIIYTLVMLLVLGERGCNVCTYYFT